MIYYGFHHVLMFSFYNELLDNYNNNICHTQEDQGVTLKLYFWEKMKKKMW